MSDREIQIIINKQIMERTVYWIVIIILAGLLIFSYLNNDDSEPKEVKEETEDETAVTEEDDTPAVVPVEKEAAEPEPESCDDGEKNQDETDVDCGGTTCDACGEDKDCNLNSDCEDGICEDGKCDAEPELSGEVSVKITKVLHEDIDDRARVTEITFQVENGIDGVLNARIEAWVKTDDGDYYLNQPQFEEEDGENPYGLYSLPMLASGASKSYTMTREDGDFEAGYLFSDFYDPGDDFLVEIKLIGKNGEGILDTATYTVNV